MARFRLPENQKRKAKIYYLTPPEKEKVDKFVKKLRGLDNE